MEWATEEGPVGELDPLPLPKLSRPSADIGEAAPHAAGGDLSAPHWFASECMIL